MRKYFSSRRAHKHGHTHTHTHFKTLFCLAAVFVSLWPKPPIVELTAERGVGGWSHSARAMLAQKKATTQTKTWQGIERQYFSKNWLPSLSLVLVLSLSLCETSCSLGSCFDSADPRAQGEIGAYMCVFMRPHDEGEGGGVTHLGTLHLQISTETRQATGCWNTGARLNTGVRCWKPCTFQGLAFCCNPFCLMAGPIHMFFQM